MVREILIWPDPVLKQKAKPVAKVDDSVRTLVKDMFETMYAADGVGLAAPQVGVLQRVIVLDTTPRQDTESKPIAMINPEIIGMEGETTYTEGCLSIPGEAEDVDRAAVVTVKFLDVEGQEQTLRCDGLLAIAVQHEVDHLDGTVFVDHVSTLKRELIRKRMKKLKTERDGASDGVVRLHAGPLASGTGPPRHSARRRASGQSTSAARATPAAGGPFIHRSGGSSACMSTSTLSGCCCEVKPSRYASRFTWVSTGKAASPPRWMHTTPAVLRPTPGSCSSASRERGTSPPCSATSALAAATMFFAFARYSPHVWMKGSTTSGFTEAYAWASGKR